MLNSGKGIQVFCFVVFLITLPISGVFSQGNIHLGALKVHPSLEDRITATDNVYKSSNKNEFATPTAASFSVANPFGVLDPETEIDNHKRTDVYNEIIPGIKLELPVGGRIWQGKIKKLDFDWHSVIRNYANNADLNRQDHFLIGGVTFEVFKGFDIKLSEDFSHTDEAAGSETDRQHPRDSNTGSIAFNFSQFVNRYLKKTEIELKYENYIQDYSQNAQEKANRMEHRFSLKMTYKLSAKLKVYPKYTYGMTKYVKDRNGGGSATADALSNSHFNEILGGIEWLATAKTTGTLEMGYLNRDYSRSSRLDSAINTPTVSTFVMKAGIKANLIYDTLLNVNLHRAQHESEFTGGSNSFISTGGGLNLTRTFGAYLTASVFGNYSTAIYKGSEREDHTYIAGLNASYEINKWLLADVGYTYNDKHSNIQAESDRENKISVGIKASF